MTRIIAHRANIKSLPENTLEGIEACLNYGVDGIELDIRHDSNGEPFLSHDPFRKSHKLPRLEEALQLIKTTDTFFLLEFKDLPSKQSMKLIKDYYGNQSEKLRIISFNHKLLLDLKSESDFFNQIKMHALFEVPRTTWSTNHINGIDGVNTNIYWPGQSCYFKAIGLETCLWWLTDKLSPKTVKTLYPNLDFLTTDRYEMYSEASRLAAPIFQ